MNREEANQYLQKLFMIADITDEYGDMCDTEPYETAVDMAIKALEQPEQKTGKWIPVSERLPEVGEVVLLTIHEIGWNGCEYDSVVSGVYNSNKNHISAWMPLPEPYGGDLNE